MTDVVLVAAGVLMIGFTLYIFAAAVVNRRRR